MIKKIFLFSLMCLGTANNPMANMTEHVMDLLRPLIIGGVLASSACLGVVTGVSGVGVTVVDQPIVCLGMAGASVVLAGLLRSALSEATRKRGYDCGFNQDFNREFLLDLYTLFYDAGVVAGGCIGIGSVTSRELAAEAAL